MKNSLITTGLLLASSLTVVILTAQDIQGTATYFSKTNIELNLEGREMSEEMKQNIQSRMKSMGERTYTLDFNRSTSNYKQEEELATPGNGGGGMRMMMMGGGASGSLYKDVQSGMYKEENDLMGKLFLVEDSLAVWDWQLESETKQIGEYTCHKATALRQLSESEIALRTRMRERFQQSGENQNEQTETEIMEEEELPIITAWYTMDIPVSHGPSDYHGLPGLILEVNEDRTTILCSKIILNPEKEININEPTKGKVVTQAEFEDTRMKKMEEMESRFEGQGRRQGRNRMIIRGN